MPHIGRQRQHDVAVPWPGASSRKTSTQRPAESPAYPVTPDRPKVSLEVMNIDGMTLCEREARGERAQSRLMYGFGRGLPLSDRDADQGDLCAATRMTRRPCLDCIQALAPG